MEDPILASHVYLKILCIWGKQISPPQPLLNRRGVLLENIWYSLLLQCIDKLS